MKWSKYSIFFETKKGEHLLYNSASNSFMKIEKELVSTIEAIIQNPDMDLSDNLTAYVLLRNGGHLVEDHHDKDVYNIFKMRMLTRSYANSTLALTIAPTLACNFDCPYCFEKSRNNSYMTEEVQDNIVDFIEKHKKIDRVHIVWYGGEPLLHFDRIKELDKKILSTGKSRTAGMISNGYLFNQDSIGDLNSLSIQYIQITIDGSRETHNARRRLIGGGGTYDKIMSNIGDILRSDYQGTIKLRVNIDESNYDEFVDVYNAIKDNYGEYFNKKISIYPGFIHNHEDPSDGSVLLSADKARFLLHLANDYGITDVLPLFPKTTLGGCTYNTRHVYTVDPKGDLYKCLGTLGNEDHIVGNVKSFRNWNTAYLAECMVGSSHLDDAKCKECIYFPICDGGCPMTRVLSGRDGLERDNCSYFKSHLQDLLEVYYEQRKD